MTGRDVEKNERKKALCFPVRAGLCFTCGTEEEVEALLVAKRVSEGAAIQKLTDDSNWHLSQQTYGRKWSLEISLIFKIRRGWQLQFSASFRDQRLD